MWKGKDKFELPEGVDIGSLDDQQKDLLLKHWDDLISDKVIYLEPEIRHKLDNILLELDKSCSHTEGWQIINVVAKKIRHTLLFKCIDIERDEFCFSNVVKIRLQMTYREFKYLSQKDKNISFDLQFLKDSRDNTTRSVWSFFSNPKLFGLNNYLSLKLIIFILFWDSNIFNDFKQDTDELEKYDIKLNIEDCLLQYDTFTSWEKNTPESIVKAFDLKAQELKGLESKMKAWEKELKNDFWLKQREFSNFIKEVKISLHNLWYKTFIDFKNKTIEIKKVYHDGVPVQIPLGIWYDPQREVLLSMKSIGLLRIFFSQEREAQIYWWKRRVVIYDTPQISNYKNFKSSKSKIEIAPYDYINYRSNDKWPDKWEFDSVALEIAKDIWKNDADFVKLVINSFWLKNIEVITFWEIETQELFIDLKKEISKIVYDDKNLNALLLKTVNDRFLKKAWIWIKWVENPENKDQIKKDLAEYALNVIVLHIYNKWDTIVHKAEEKNYKVTKALLNNSLYRNKILEIFKLHDKTVTEQELEEISFPKSEAFQWISLDDRQTPEDYKHFVWKSSEEIVFDANNVLLSWDPGTWSAFFLASPERKLEYINKVILPILIWYYYFKYWITGREKFKHDLSNVKNIYDLIGLVNHALMKFLKNN